jgi:hypothetical protein
MISLLVAYITGLIMLVFLTAAGVLLGHKVRSYWVGVGFILLWPIALPVTFLYLRALVRAQQKCGV